MRKLLFTLLLISPLVGIGQDIEALNDMVNGGKSLIKSVNRENDVYMKNVYNEDNKAIVYEININNKTIVDIFKTRQSKENLISGNKNKDENDGIGRMAFKHNIIVKYVYYFEDSVLKSFTIFPQDWGY